MTPVAATKTSSPRTRSSWVSTRSTSKPGVDERCALASSARPQPALERAAEALDRRGRDDALRRAADAHQHVDPGEGWAAAIDGRDVAVADQVDARARVAQLGDQVVVAVALEHDDGEIVRLACPSPRRRARTFSVGEASMSIASAASGPTAILSM